VKQGLLIRSQENVSDTVLNMNLIEVAILYTQIGMQGLALQEQPIPFTVRICRGIHGKSAGLRLLKFIHSQQRIS
jgi:hypothetical protein